MNSDVRDRLVLPIVVPVGIVVVFVGAAFGLSRAMMTVPDLIATILALVLAAAVIAFAAVRSSSEGDPGRRGLLLLGAVVVIAVGAGAVGMAIGPRESLAALIEEAEAPSEIFIAIDTDFVEAPTELPAGEQTFVLQNDGGLRHSVAIDEFGGQLVLARGGETAEETVTLEPGTYEFYCDIADHRGRGMYGELTVTG